MNDRRPNNLNGHGQVVNEFTMVSTRDEFVLCVQFSDGSVGKAYERRAISGDKMEVIQHMNRDRNGNYYTSKSIYDLADGAVVNPDHIKTSPEEFAKTHLNCLCKSATDQIRGSEKKPASYKQNLLSTMKHWLDVEARNKHMQEYETLSEIVTAFENKINFYEEELTMSKTKAPVEAPAEMTAQQYPPMQVDVRIHAIKTQGNVLANATANLNGCFAIRGIRVMDGKNGPYVAMPDYKSGDKYKDICFPCTKEFKQEFDQAVLSAYQQELAMLPQRQQENASQEQAAPAMGMSMSM